MFTFCLHYVLYYLHVCNCFPCTPTIACGD